MREDQREALTGLGRRVRQRRRELGMKQIILARRCRLPSGVLSSIESGKRTPTLPTIIALADALGCTCDYLLREPIETCWGKV